MSVCLQVSLSRHRLAQPRAVAAKPRSRVFTQQQRPPMHLRRWQLMAAAEAAEAEAAEEIEEGEEVEEVNEAAAGATEEWAAERLARLEADRGSAAEESRFSLNFLWLDKNIGVAVDQVFAKGQRSPVTDFFFWPRRDAWEELKTCLESKSWIGERDRVLLLNQCTEVINFWQEGEKKTLEQAKEAFPDAKFQGQ